MSVASTFAWNGPRHARGDWRRHWLPVAAFVVTATWLMRRLLFSSLLPAGTDMLDLLARTRLNANWTAVLSPLSQSGFQLPRQASLENILGVLTMITGDPVTVVKPFMFALLLGAGGSAYFLVWKWYRAVVPATVAGILYMTSQALIGRLASGWLHYGTLIALTPLLLYFWVALVDRFSFRHALAFTLIVNTMIFARQDMVLWVIPFLGLYPITRAVAQPKSQAFSNTLRALAVFIPTTLVLTLYLTMPLIAGIRAPWLSTGNLFQAVRFNLLDRSLTAFQSLLGLGRDMAYLPFSGQEWWNFHPYMTVPLYYSAQGLIVAFAYASLIIRRDKHTVFLVSCAAAAAFLGKGLREPLGTPYWWAVRHLPVFGNLRGPNRWLIVQSLAYAVLAGVTLYALSSYFSDRLRGFHRYLTPLGHLATPAIFAVMLVPVAPTLLSGFLGWQPDRAESDLMRPIARDKSEFAVASVPYGQSIMFVKRPHYSGWEHDLGVESSLWTGRPAISNNSWGRRESEYVDYTAGLLQSADPAFTELLRSTGIKYLLRFNYPPSSPSLLAAGNGNDSYQQRAVDTMRGPVTSYENRAGRLYTLPESAPLLSFRPNIAVTLGGRASLAGFTQLPGINASDWATFTADDLLTSEHGSLRRLINYLNTADLILATNESAQDIALLATPPVARVPGIATDPGPDRKRGLLITDESARRGSLADQSIPPPGLITGSERTFHVDQPTRLELWARMLFSSRPGRATFYIDGNPAKTFLPLSPGTGGFRWVRVAATDFQSGTHTVRIEGGASDYGRTFEVDDARLVAPATRNRILGVISHELEAQSHKIAYAFDVPSARYAVGTPNEPNRIGVDPVSPHDTHFWRPQRVEGITPEEIVNEEGRFLSVDLSGPRPFFTFALHNFQSPQSWEGRDTLLLPYRGTGSGETYNFIVDFTRDHKHFESFSIVDERRGWHVWPVHIGERPGRWDHVVSLRIATETRSVRGHLDIKQPAWLFPSELHFTESVGQAPVQQPTLTGLTNSRETKAELVSLSGRKTLEVTVPIGLSREAIRVIIQPSSLPASMPASPVKFRSAGSAEYKLSFVAPRRGVLVFNRTDDPRWNLTIDGHTLHPLPAVESLTAGFLLRPGQHRGLLGYAGRTLVWAAWALSAFGLAAVVTLLLALSIRERRATRRAGLIVLDHGSGEGDGDAEHNVITDSPVHRAINAVRWWPLAAALTIIVLVAPLAIRMNQPHVADVLAVLALGLIVITLVMTVIQQGFINRGYRQLPLPSEPFIDRPRPRTRTPAGPSVSNRLD